MIIAHRINSLSALNGLPPEFGVEIDIRHDNRSDSLYLNHDPGIGDDFGEFLKLFHHRSIVLNIKESGIEDRVLAMVQDAGLSKDQYFLLDVEFPYMYNATRRGVREIAFRYSEDEPIEAFLPYRDKVDWLWIDTNTELPLNREVIAQFGSVKTCLVCPERWGRPEDIEAYIEQMKELGFTLDAVMTAQKYASQWAESGVVKL